MPGLDSADVLRAMRAVYPRLLVIASSGFTEPEAAARLTDSVAFQQKPYELPQLRDVLQRGLPDVMRTNRDWRIYDWAPVTPPSCPW